MTDQSVYLVGCSASNFVGSAVSVLFMTSQSITIVVCPGLSSDGMGACLQQAMVETSRSRTEVTLQLAVADHATCSSLPM
jgi:hypothetical protein